MSAPNDERDDEQLMTNTEFAEMVANITSMRKEWIDRLTDPRRDIEKECGFPAEGSFITAWYYQKLYNRNFLAARVVECLPKEAWHTTFNVFEDHDEDNVTPFEEDWDALGMGLLGDKSYFKNETGSPIWEYLQRIDIMSGIGRYGVLLLGLDDGLPLFMPVAGVEEEGSIAKDAPDAKPEDGVPGVQGTDKFYYDWAMRIKATSNKPRFLTNAEGKQELVDLPVVEGVPMWPTYSMTFNAAKKVNPKVKLQYLKCFPETLAQITQFESNPNSPRFGQPVMYLLTFNDASSQGTAAAGMPLTSMNVHWTRVIHVADVGTGAVSNEVFAMPRQEQVLDNILGAKKLYAGAPEMFWKGAFPGLSLESNPQLGGDVKINKAHLRQTISEYQNGLTRVLTLMGLQAKTLAPQVVDATPFADMQIKAITIKLNIPQRIFEGSERGELASSQDQGDWTDELRARNSNYTIPRMIVRLIDRVILIGLVRPPKENYFVEQEDVAVLSETERATVCSTQTTALQAYIAGNVQSIIPPREYLINFMGLEPELAEAILDAAEQAQMDQLQEQQDAGLVDEFGQPVQQPTGAVDEIGNPVTEQVDPAIKPHLKPKQPTDNLDWVFSEEELATLNREYQRDKQGRFGKGSGVRTKGGEVLYQAQRDKVGVWKDKAGTEAPEHVQKLGIPPAWKNVHVNPDPDGTLLAKGVDAKGRTQMRYSDNHWAQAAAAKFGRVSELRKKRKEILTEVDKDAKKPELKENAEVLKLIMHTGIRPGGDADTKATHESYGATTLEGRHVVVKDGEVSLVFPPGKHQGRPVTFPIRDKGLAAMLQERAKAAGDKGRLFDTTADSLRDYSKTKDGTGFKTKDHRTALGTETAVSALKDRPAPKTMKEYKAMVKEVATEVAKVLGNTPSIALKSYIDPTVFATFRPLGA